MMLHRGSRPGPEGARRPSWPRIVMVCLLAVAALFLGYEIVERAWLGGVSPEVLRTLHILRGLSAAAIAAALATTLLLRQIYDDAPREPLLPAGGSLKRRLQHVRMRTKIVIPMVALAVAPAMAIGTFMILRARDSLRENVVGRVGFDTVSKARGIEEFSHAVQQDLSFMRQTKVIRDLVAAAAAGAPERIAVLKEEAEREFSIFFQSTRAYCQVQCLSGAGRQLIGLDTDQDLYRIVFSREQPDRTHPSHARAAPNLKPGEVYISPAHLDTMHGMPGAAQHGVLTYATPVVGGDGNRHGLLIISICIGHILSRIGPLPSGTEAWLVDGKGFYLGYVGESKEKRQLYEVAKRRRLSADFAPEEISTILKRGAKEQPIETAGVLVFSAPIVFGGGGSDQQWTLVISTPRAPIEAPVRHLTVFLSVVLVLVVAVASVLGVLVAHYLAGPVANLRRATREIAAGNLSRRVEINTGDEIEGLAIDFNTMTERLGEAQERLSTWNVELGREVARQTEHLHHLQSGLSRADKLASIGQMTAGVLHEIGNPLAAIKTKIQVAEEESDLCAECRGVLSEVIKEVDRLATFLRTFARLARLGKPKVKEVSLAEVVQGVITLVTPQLRRTGMSLRVEPATDLPVVHGNTDQLRQLLINLILNAAEASPGGGEIVVRVQQPAPAPAGIRTSNAVSIEVADHGMGMSREVLDKIWEPFFTTKPDGTGLGLAICRQIVQDHGGTIQARSKPGEGTVVTMTFPPFVVEESKPGRVPGPQAAPGEPS